MANDFDDIDLPLDAVISQEMLAAFQQVMGAPTPLTVEESVRKIFDTIGAVMTAVIKLELTMLGHPPEWPQS